MQPPTNPGLNMNQYIADQLLEMSELHARDYRRKKAYQEAAQAVRSHPVPITSGTQAIKISKIGKSSAEAIDQILASGQIAVLAQQPEPEKEKRRVIKLFKKIHGVGQKYAEDWYNRGFRTLQDLVQLFNTGGMNDGQRLGFYYYNDLKMRIPRAEMDIYNNVLHKIFDPVGVEFAITGSYRRLYPDSGDVDIMMKSVTSSGVNIMMSQVVATLQQYGLILGSFTPDADVKTMLVVRLPPGIFQQSATSQVQNQYPVRQMDIYLIPPVHWAFALLYFTGSKGFNIKMRARATQFGLSMSQFGFINVQTDQPFPGPEQNIPLNTEEEIFAFLKIKYLKPEERTDTVELTYTDQQVQNPPPPSSNFLAAAMQTQPPYSSQQKTSSRTEQEGIHPEQEASYKTVKPQADANAAAFFNSFYPKSPTHEQIEASIAAELLKTGQANDENVVVAIRDAYEGAENVYMFRPGVVRQPNVLLSMAWEMKPDTGKWYRPVDTLLIYLSDTLLQNISQYPNPRKIAAFDLDSTLVNNRKGHTFTQSPDDVQVMPNRIPRLQSLLRDQYILVIFTNQKATTQARREKTFSILQRKISILNLPVLVFAALDDDQFRKPGLGMWREMDKILGAVDYSKSFYCGDAAGRPGDHSDSDLEFAQNERVQFYTPEQLFQ